MTKFCRDCHHTRRYRLSIDHSADGKNWACLAPQNELGELDLVTGDPRLRYLTCQEARQEGACGPEGSWWQAKPPWNKEPSKAPLKANAAADELSPEDFL
jgi:hypothetical protein